jgi:hypothetical protein
LQQAVHRFCACQVLRDLVHHPMLRPGQLEGQSRQQLFGQAAHCGPKDRRSALRTFAARHQLAQLLSQQLLPLQPLPGRAASVLQRSQAGMRCRVVKRVQGLPQRRQAGPNQVRRNHLLQRRALQGAGHGLAQVGLRQCGRRRVNRREGSGQRRVVTDGLEHRVHHFVTKEAAANLTAHANLRACSQGLLV